MFERVQPTEALCSVIDCYWFVEDNDPTPRIQKIIPDGYPEIILHYGAQYRINITGRWETQALHLFAGQIRNHFHVENTGPSRIVGIKLRPTAPTRLFGTDMRGTVDAVVELTIVAGDRLDELVQRAGKLSGIEELTLALDDFWTEQIFRLEPGDEVVETALETILSSHGTVRVSNLALPSGVGERQLERLFARHVGLSPKRFARIVRFVRIFDLAQKGNLTWSELALESGHYDQAHFIRNFQEFTGEDPSMYGFGEQNLANFFLNRPG